MVRFASQLFLLEAAADLEAGPHPQASLERLLGLKKGPDAYLWGRLVCSAVQLAELHPAAPVGLSVRLTHPGELELIGQFHARQPRNVRVEAVEAPIAIAAELARSWLYPTFLSCDEEPQAELGPPPRVGVQVDAAQLSWVRRRALPFKLQVGAGAIDDWVAGCLSWFGFRGLTGSWGERGLESSDGVCSAEQLRDFRQHGGRSFTVPPDWSPPWS